MSSTIVVPLDGSPLSERALQLAARLASASSAQLVLTQVLPRKHTETIEADQEVREVQAYLHDTAAEFEQSEVQVDTVVTRGEPATEILRVARQRHAELLVMSTHGRSGSGRWLYGSVADEILRRAEIPLVLLPPEARTQPTTQQPPRILVPLDGSSLGEAVLGPACAWAERFGAEVILLEVVEWPPVLYGDGTELLAFDPVELEAVAREYLEPLATKWQSTTNRIRCRTILGRPVPTTIARVAEEEHVDMIAMATHGRSGIARLVLGSVATGTLQRADVPLLLVRPPALAARVAA